MDFSTINLDALVPKLEARRVSLNLSYQNIADACNVSQSTIIRIFKRQADPSIVVLKSILAAVKYDIVSPPLPDEDSGNERIAYLKKSIALSLNAKIKLCGSRSKKHNLCASTTKIGGSFGFAWLSALSLCFSFASSSATTSQT